MFIREKDKVDGIDWGNGRSYRLLVENDGLNFAVAHTVVTAGSESRLQYTRHIEACYCVSGSGEVANADETEVYQLRPGTLYVLDRHDPHCLRAHATEDLHLISIFNPPIAGTERHTLSETGFSHY